MEERVISRQAVDHVLKEYWRQYKKHSVYTTVSFLLPAVGTILVAFVPPLVVAQLIDIFAAQGKVSLDVAVGYIALFGGLWLVGEILWRIGLHLLIKVEAEGMNSLGQTAFSLLLDRDYDFYSNNFVGSLTKKALAFSRNFEIFTDTLIFNVITNVFPMIFAFVVLWRYSPWIPLTLILWIAIAFGVALPLIKRRSRLVALRHDSYSKMAGRLSDAIGNILAIKSFTREEQEHRTYGEFVDDFTARAKRTMDYHNLRLDSAMSPIYVIANVFGLTLAIFFAQQFNLAAGVIVVVFSYYSQITQIFWQINRVYRNVESSISEAAEFAQLFVSPPAIQDVSEAVPLKVNKADIQFKQASFRYISGRRKRAPFLNDFSLDIKGNQKVGLVGPSGGGKTTIAKLLLRFIDLQSGSIMIDGQDIRGVTQRSLREAVAYVPQEPLLFHRTLMENIACGRENATRAEVINAAKLARADDFIRQLSDGYQTLVGERGIKLSGGQRQRVAIARAILKDAPILVLDEATSSLDSESEKYIQEGLKELMKNKTALVIAHRLSTIRYLDRIVVLDKGRIVQDDTHDELIRRKGLYAQLWRHQSGEFLKD